MAQVSDKLITEVTNLIKLGVPPLTASMAKGISEAEFCKWMEKGAQGGKGNWRYAKFFEAVNTAEAECEAFLVGKIRSIAGDGNWSAAAWLAERRFPEKYVKRSVNSKQQEEETGEADPFADVDNVMPLRKRA
jgi:hypothetical protein